jgi:hypothetical protein
MELARKAMEIYPTNRSALEKRRTWISTHRQAPPVTAIKSFGMVAIESAWKNYRAAFLHLVHEHRCTE